MSDSLPSNERVRKILTEISPSYQEFLHSSALKSSKEGERYTKLKFS